MLAVCVCVVGGGGDQGVDLYAHFLLGYSAFYRSYQPCSVAQV